MARLKDLPSDLLPSIFDHLTRREFFALVQVCHALKKEATPYLYRDIKFMATNSSSCARRLAFLLRTLLERPRLTSYVTALRLFGPHPCWEKYDPWPENNERLTSVKLWGFDRSTRTQSLLTPEMFHHFVDDDMQLSQAQLRGRSKDALAALIMTHLTNLSTLELGDGFLRHSIFMPQILKRTDYLFPGLELVVLGNRHFDQDNTIAYTDLNLIRPVFYSSTIKMFEWTMTQPWEFRWSESKPPWNTNLTCLRLFRTNITRSTLHQLLSATPNLKCFYYEQEIVFNNFTPCAPSLASYLELGGLNSALACVQETLEQCQLIWRLAPGSITSSRYANSGIRFPAIEGTLSVLNTMPRLKKIEVPMAMLFGLSPRYSAKLEDVLPPSISELTLRDDFIAYGPWARPSSSERRIARVGKYIRNRDCHAPSLTTLRIRLTNAKEYLHDAVRDLSLSTSGKDVRTAIVRGTKSETYCWQFEQVKVNLGRPGVGARVDSVLHPRSPEHEYSLIEKPSF